MQKPNLHFLTSSPYFLQAPYQGTYRFSLYGNVSAELVIAGDRDDKNITKRLSLKVLPSKFWPYSYLR